MNAQTSDRISSLAARYADISSAELMSLTISQAEVRASDIRSMAMSLLRQDEVRGIRKFIRKVTGL